ncbi:MAG: indole-3-glycerol phosphate synthase TrpC [Nitrospirae bacterium]|nr:indole-3-glycerol phosphate synthase TrpC [Nitrospirota bacterium]
MSILEKIVDKKKERLASSKRTTPHSALIAAIGGLEKPKDFAQAIKRTDAPLRLIAEIKKASPSKGLIRPDFDHVKIASIYEDKKVDAISVLTEEDFFQGRLEYLPEVRKISSRPLLRKDFIIDEYQIYEARANMADAVLLIAAILGEKQAGEYLHISRDLGMSVLFEVHDYDELEMALRLDVPIIGINNRNLKTLAIDLDTTFNLMKEIPAGKTVVSESGISGRDDVLRLEQAGIDAMLVGSSLMASRDMGAQIDRLRGVI